MSSRNSGLDGQQLENANPPAIACPAAFFAPGTPVKHSFERTSAQGFEAFTDRGRHRRLDFALRAEPAQEPLRQDTFERGGNQKCLDAHIQQPRDRAGRVIRMERAEHLVAGQRGANRDLGCFRIPDLAHHHHVRVLPQNRPQTVGKMKIPARPNRDLRHARQFILDGVFDGQNLFLDGINPA